MLKDYVQAPELAALIRDLCRFNTGVVALENENLFARINRELPLTLYRYPSGSTFNGWEVPQLWQVHKASISREGRQLFDGMAHPLGVAVYSRSFQGEVAWEDLQPHLVTNPELPQAYVYHCMWQYRPWAADWALSVPYEVCRSWGPGTYRVELLTRYDPGEMLVAEYEHPGKSERTMVFNCHTCHPGMANDAMAGVALLIRLFQWLRGQDTYYTYRLVLGPEHLGTVFYLRDQTEAQLKRLVGGIFPEMPGTAGPIRVASTYLGDQPLDLACRNAVKHYSGGHNLVPWRRGAGNDETVWEAPGYEVPFVEMTRCLDPDFPYPEYHTSLDTPDLMDEQLLQEFYQVLQRVVAALEHNHSLYRNFTGLICLSNPKYDLYFERHDPAVTKDLNHDSDKWGHLLNHLFRCFDGSRSILEIAEEHDLPFEPLYQYLRKFQDKGLITMEFAPVRRLPVVSKFPAGHHGYD